MSAPEASRAFLDDLTPERVAAGRELATAVRDLGLAVATSTADADVIAKVLADVRRASDDLRAQPSVDRVPRGRFEGPAARAREVGEVSINLVNPMHLELTLKLPGDYVALDATGDPTGLTAEARLTIDACHEGPPNSVHGGVISFLMDCITGMLVQTTGLPAVTGTLDCRYLTRTPLERELTLRAEIVRRSGRKIVVAGWVEVEGVRTAEAQALFVQVERGTRTPDAG